MRIAVIGDECSNATPFIDAYTDGQSPETSDPGNADPYIRLKNVTMQSGDKLKLNMYKACPPCSEKLVRQCFLDAHGIFVCYDPTNPRGLECIKSVIEENREAISSRSAQIRIVKVKTDEGDEEVVAQDDVQALADSIGAKVVGCCHKDVKNVNRIFTKLFYDIGRNGNVDFIDQNRRTKAEQTPSQPPSSSLSTRTEGMPPKEPKKSFFSSLMQKKSTQPQPSATPCDEDGYSHLFKILLIGDSSSRKSALLYTYSEGQSPGDSVIGIDFKVKKLTTPSGHKLRLQIWDTSEQERFGTVASSYFRGTHGILLCFDPSAPSSFEYVKAQFNNIREQFPGNEFVFRIAAVSMRASDERAVSQEDVQAFADTIGARVSVCYLDAVDSVNMAFDRLVFGIGRKKSIDFGGSDD